MRIKVTMNLGREFPPLKNGDVTDVPDDVGRQIVAIGAGVELQEVAPPAPVSDPPVDDPPAPPVDQPPAPETQQTPPEESDNVSRSSRGGRNKRNR